jgi:multiple sugar transport system substrate-binding protein
MLAACGPQGGAPAGGATATPGGGAAGAGGLPEGCANVQMTYWNPFTGPDGPFMQEMVNNFNSANPNIQVTMNTVPGGEYITQLSTAAASDTLPDVAVMWADQVATMAYRNIFRPIPDDILGSLQLSGGDFPPDVWKAGEVAGKRYSVPLDIHPMTMFYNEDMLKAAGINEPPDTREEFEQAAQAMTKGDQKGFMLTTGFPVAQIFAMLLYQFGGRWFNEDGTKAEWNSDAGVQALTWMREAQTKYGEPNLEVDAELAAFKAGKVGMIWNGIWQTTNVTGQAVSFTGKATKVPQIGTKYAVWGGSHQLAMPVKKSPDRCKDAAWGIFVKYILDNSINWAKAGQIPANNRVRNSAEFKAIEPQASIAPSVEAVFFPPSVPGITDAFAPLDEAIGAVMTGKTTDIKGELDRAAEKANQILAENKQKYGTAPK